MDGTPHLHALGVWRKRKNIISMNAFDVDGCHPNIQTARSVKDVYLYVIKHGDYIKNCDFSDKRKYSEIVEESESKEQFIAGVLKHYPRDVVYGLERIQYFADWKWGSSREEYIAAYQEYNICNTMKTWMETEFIKVGK